MAVRKGWFPREGFTADAVQDLIKKTLLNPVLTLPLFLLLRYTQKGHSITSDHSTALNRLKYLAYIGIAKWINGILNDKVLNNGTVLTWDWDKEIVLITGGSDGIGKEIVLGLVDVKKNVKIIILDIQPPTYVLPSPNIHYHHCDLTSPPSIASATQHVLTTHGAPTILINNAGLANGFTILATPDPALERIFALNILAHFRLARAFLPAMISANHGMIVTIASMAGFVTTPQLVDYSCTKAAAISFHEGLAAELVTRYDAPRVRTLCVCPSYARTKLARGVRNKDSFLSPMLEVRSVADAVVEGMVAGKSGLVHLPRVHQWLGGTVRGWPWWLQVDLRKKAKDAMDSFVGYGEGKVDKEGEVKPRLEHIAEGESRLNEEVVVTAEDAEEKEKEEAK